MLRPPRSTLVPYTKRVRSEAKMGKVMRHTLGIPAEPLFRSEAKMGKSVDRKSGSAGMPRPISYAVFCLKKKKTQQIKQGGQRNQMLSRHSNLLHNTKRISL